MDGESAGLLWSLDSILRDGLLSPDSFRMIQRGLYEGCVVPLLGVCISGSRPSGDPRPGPSGLSAGTSAHGEVISRPYPYTVWDYVIFFFVLKFLL